MNSLSRLLQIMVTLRDPMKGCEWDRAQTFASIAPYTIEEAYEVSDAIERGDMDDLRAELGDLLLQVVFHARMAEEAHLFDFDDVANSISDKMIARHPHIFGTENGVMGDARWEDLKADERKERGADSAMDGVAMALPALMRAEKLQKRAARTGFDWPDPTGAEEKIHEEIDELRDASDADVWGKPATCYLPQSTSYANMESLPKMHCVMPMRNLNGDSAPWKLRRTESFRPYRLMSRRHCGDKSKLPSNPPIRRVKALRTGRVPSV